VVAVAAGGGDGSARGWRSASRAGEEPLAHA
jgi:hypothetical protein